MERLDDVLGYADLKIYQDSQFFSFSLDSVILANFINVRLRDQKIVDFCTGNGIVPLILSRKCDKNIIGVEIQENLASLAKKSVEYNHLENQIQIFCVDVKEFSKNHLNEFDLILCNPPYFKVEKNSSFNENYEKMIARHEVLLTLEDVCDCAKKILKDHGTISVVHRSDRLMDILELFRKYGLEPKKLRFVYETLEKESTLIYIEAQKAGKVGLKIDRPFILYELDGKMTKEYEKMQKEVVK